MEKEMISDIKHSEHDGPFQIFRKSQLTRIEQGIKQSEAQMRDEQEMAIKLYEKAMPIFKKIGFDADQLKELNEEYRKIAEEHIIQVREKYSEIFL